MTRSQRLFSLFILLAALAATSVGNVHSAEEKFWLPVGLKALQERKYKDAIEPLTKAIKQSSISWSADYHSAVVATSKVRTDKEYFEIKNRNMYVINSCTARGVAYGSLGEYKKAIDDFNLALRAFSVSPKAMCNRGRAYLSLKMPQEAIKDFDAAIKLAPNLAEAYTNRAAAFRMLGMPQRAEADSRKAELVRKDTEHEFVETIFHRECLVNDALKMNPKNVVLLTERGMVCLSSNQIDKGIEYFKKAIQIDPNFFEAYGGLSDCYMNQENYDAALAMAKQQEKMKPNDSKALIRIGLIYFNSNRLKEGAPYLRRILKLPCKTAEDYRFRGLCQIGLGKPREALVDIEKSLKLDPRNPHAWDDRAMCLHELKLYSEAIQAENRALNLKPNFPSGYIHRAQMYAKLHSLEAADADLDRALELSPNDKSAYRIKSAVEALRGNLELSFADGQTGNNPFNRSSRPITKAELIKEISRYSKIISTIPSQPAPFYDRAVLRIAMENLPAGIEDLRSFLRLSKWNGRSASYAASLLALTLRENGQANDADEVLKTAAKRMTPANSVPIIDFLLRKKDQQAMLKASMAGNTETRDRLLLGIYLWQNKKYAEAKTQLDWVQNKGDQNIDEYVLVSVYRQRLALTPRKERRQFDSR